MQATPSSLKMLDVGKWPIFSLCSEEELQLIRQACVFGSAGNEVLYTTVNNEVILKKKIQPLLFSVIHLLGGLKTLGELRN